MFVTHGADGLGDEACNQPRWPGTLTATVDPCGGLDSIAEHGGDVFGILERMRGDDLRQELFEVVVVRLGLAEGRRQGAKGGRSDSLVELPLGESRAPKEVD